MTNVVQMAARQSGKSLAVAALRIWQGIESPEPPNLRHEYPDLLAMASAMLASRQARFPRLVQAGQMAADDAQQQLATFTEIEADWRWICHGIGTPPPHATIDARRDALDASIATIAGIAAQRGGFDPALEHQAHCVIAMRWRLEPGVELATRVTAQLTHEMRAAAKAARSEKETALAR
jgi:hypothetical protein